MSYRIDAYCRSCSTPNATRTVCDECRLCWQCAYVEVINTNSFCPGCEAYLKHIDEGIEELIDDDGGVA